MNGTAIATSPRPTLSNRRQIAGILGTVFALFVVTGAALPVLPVYIHDVLGFGPMTIGGVTGVQFAAALALRVAAGVFTDRRGSKATVIVGISLATTAALLYVASLIPKDPVAAVAILLAARAVLGAAESFVIVGAQSRSNDRHRPSARFRRYKAVRRARAFDCYGAADADRPPSRQVAVGTDRLALRGTGDPL